MRAACRSWSTARSGTSPPSASCPKRNSSPTVSRRRRIWRRASWPALSGGFAEIRFAHALVSQQLARFIVQRDCTRFHDVAAARHLEREARVLLDEQDGYAALRDLPHDVEDLR